VGLKNAQGVARKRQIGKREKMEKKGMLIGCDDDLRKKSGKKGGKPLVCRLPQGSTISYRTEPGKKKQEVNKREKPNQAAKFGGRRCSQ